MKKLLILLIFGVFPVLSFAQTNDIIWSKDLGKGIVWQQTLSGDILKYKGKIITSSTGGFIDVPHKLCAYEGIRGFVKGKLPTFTINEIKQLVNIGVIKNGLYDPLESDKYSPENLNILYRITSRYCDSNTFINANIGKRWIFITLYNTKLLYDTELGVFNDMFLPDRDMKKGKTGFFAIGLLNENEQIELLPFDGKSYISGIGTLFADYSEGDIDATVIVNNYELLSNRKIRVTFSVLHNSGDKTFKKEFQILTPK